MWALIVLTITVGNLFAIRQKNLKRFLAFSSISQAGYIMLGIIAGSAQGMAALVYYVLVYIFSNLAPFRILYFSTYRLVEYHYFALLLFVGGKSYVHQQRERLCHSSVP